MNVKFVEEFRKASDGKFGMLKFNSAIYSRDTHRLQVRFIVAAKDASLLTDDVKNGVAKTVADMFNGVETEVQYIRTFADENTVFNKIVEFFNLNNQMVFRRLKRENVSVSLSDDYLTVELLFDAPTCKMLAAANTEENLKDFLDVNFNLGIDVSVRETFFSDDNDASDSTEPIDTVVYSTASLRLVRIENPEKVYARGKIAGLGQLPNYIGDVKNAAENMVLCGKVAGVSKKMYNNKKFSPDDPKSGPEQLPLIRFVLDDTTGRMECVCFPRPEEAVALEQLAEKEEVAVAGKVSLSSYTGQLSLAVNALFRCKIDYSSINVTPSKPAPPRYSVVKPVPYEEPPRRTLLDESDEKVEETPEFMRNKTFVVFDFEATGLNIAEIEPIEIGAAKIVNGKVTETFSSLLNPGMKIPDLVVEKTHITDKMVADKPAFKDVLPDFFKFTRGAVLVGHNLLGYDFPLLSKYAEAEGYIFDNDTEDTLILARKYIPEVKRWGLEDLSKAFSIVHDDAHRAMADVLATAELLKIIASRF